MTRLIPLSDIPYAARDEERRARRSYTSPAADHRIACSQLADVAS